jgi:RNA polymerase sigma-70 factor (sigma-E family)
MTFEEFVAARLGALLRYATALTCDPHQADDVVAEVLVRASSRWRRIARMDQPEAYVKRMIVNEFISTRRRSSRTVPMSHDQLDSAASGFDPHAGLPDRDALMRQVRALPRKQRAVIALRYFEGHTYDEIAELLGVRPSTVRVHASQALARLRTDVTSVGEIR